MCIYNRYIISYNFGLYHAIVLKKIIIANLEISILKIFSTYDEISIDIHKYVATYT